MQMILLGYITVFAYIFFLIFALGPLVKKFTTAEASRKVIHIMLFMVWVFLDLFFRHTVHQIIIPVCFLVLNALSYKFKIYKSVEREDGNHMGTVYFAIAVTIIMTAAYFLPELFPHTGIAVFCLTFGDGFAALVGYHTRSRELYKGKSLYGTLACALASMLSLAVFRLVYMPSLGWSSILLLGLLCAMLELVGWGLDNFSTTIPILIISRLLATCAEAALPLWIALAVAMAVFAAGSIDYFGSLLAGCMVFCFGFFGGWKVLAFLLACYGAIYVIGKLRRAIGKDGKKHARNFWQILINGGLGTLIIIWGYLAGKTAITLVGLISIAGCFIDSVSSDVGTLSKKTAFDLLRWEEVDTGLSGGITVLGTAAAIIATLATAALAIWATGISWAKFPAVALVIFSQTVIDTCLGSRAQVKYRCPRCRAVTEKKTHCAVPTFHYRGLRFVDNNVVNLISAIITVNLAIIVFIGVV